MTVSSAQRQASSSLDTQLEQLTPTTQSDAHITKLCLEAILSPQPTFPRPPEQFATIIQTIRTLAMDEDGICLPAAREKIMNKILSLPQFEKTRAELCLPEEFYPPVPLSDILPLKENLKPGVDDIAVHLPEDSPNTFRRARYLGSNPINSKIRCYIDMELRHRPLEVERNECRSILYLGDPVPSSDLIPLNKNLLIGDVIAVHRQDIPGRYDRPFDEPGMFRYVRYAGQKPGDSNTILFYDNIFCTKEKPSEERKEYFRSVMLIRRKFTPTPFPPWREPRAEPGSSGLPRISTTKNRLPLNELFLKGQSLTPDTPIAIQEPYDLPGVLREYYFVRINPKQPDQIRYKRYLSQENFEETPIANVFALLPDEPSQALPPSSPNPLIGKPVAVNIIDDIMKIIVSHADGATKGNIALVSQNRRSLVFETVVEQCTLGLNSLKAFLKNRLKMPQEQKEQLILQSKPHQHIIPTTLSPIAIILISQNKTEIELYSDTLSKLVLPPAEEGHRTTLLKILEKFRTECEQSEQLEKMWERAWPIRPLFSPIQLIQAIQTLQKELIQWLHGLPPERFQLLRQEYYKRLRIIPFQYTHLQNALESIFAIVSIEKKNPQKFYNADILQLLQTSIYQNNFAKMFMILNGFSHTRCRQDCIRLISGEANHEELLTLLHQLRDTLEINFAISEYFPHYWSRIEDPQAFYENTKQLPLNQVSKAFLIKTLIKPTLLLPDLNQAKKLANSLTDPEARSIAWTYVIKEELQRLPLSLRTAHATNEHYIEKTPLQPFQSQVQQLIALSQESAKQPSTLFKDSYDEWPIGEALPSHLIAERSTPKVFRRGDPIAVLGEDGKYFYSIVEGAYYHQGKQMVQYYRNRETLLTSENTSPPFLQFKHVQMSENQRKFSLVRDCDFLCRFAHQTFDLLTLIPFSSLPLTRFLCIREEFPERWTQPIAPNAPPQPNDWVALFSGRQEEHENMFFLSRVKSVYEENGQFYLNCVGKNKTTTITISAHAARSFPHWFLEKILFLC